MKAPQRDEAGRVVDGMAVVEAIEAGFPQHASEGHRGPLGGGHRDRVEIRELGIHRPSREHRPRTYAPAGSDFDPPYTHGVFVLFESLPAPERPPLVEESGDSVDSK